MTTLVEADLIEPRFFQMRFARLRTVSGLNGSTVPHRR